MKILWLRVENFKPFHRLRLPEEGELPEGLILIKGPNSTGKSSLFEAILWALWGANAVPLSNDELVNATATYCRVVLSFDVAGTRFKIDRSYSSAEGTSVVLYQAIRNRWQKIADKSGGVNRKLHEILHLELNQALNTLLVRQGEVAKISMASPSELRKLLVRVYNIEILTRMTGELEHLENDLNARAQSLESDYTRPEVIQEEIEYLRSRVKKLEVELKTNTKELNRRKDDMKKLPSPSLLREIDSLIRKLERAEREVDMIVAELKQDLQEAGLPVEDAHVIEARQRVLTREIERIDQEMDGLQKQIAQIDREIGAIRGRTTDLLNKIKLLESVSAEQEGGVKCPTCSKPLTLEERDKIVDEYRRLISAGEHHKNTLATQREDIESQLKEIRARRSTIESALQAARRAAAREKRLSKAQQVLTETQNAMNNALKRIGVPDLQSLLESHGAKDVSEIQRHVAVLQTEISALEKRCVSIEQETEQESNRITELEKRIVEMTQLGAEIAALKNLSTHAKFVRLNLVSGFIANWVFQKRLIGIIRNATSQYVREFTNGQYTRIDLLPTPPRGSSGPGLVFEIEDQRDNLRKTKDQLSFGDRTAISLALRLGISRTMSAIRPLKDSPAVSPRVRCVLLDEPLGGLDRGRRESVVSNLVNDKSFRQIFLITHTEVKGWEGVPVINVEKNGSMSIASLEIENER